MREFRKKCEAMVENETEETARSELLKNLPRNALSYESFRTIIRTALPSLSFARKNRDKCQFCRQVETDGNNKQYENAYRAHLEKAANARKAMMAVVKMAENDFINSQKSGNNREVAVFQVDFMRNVNR